MSIYRGMPQERREHRQRQRDAADLHRQECYLRSRRGHNTVSWPTVAETITPTETTRRRREQHHPSPSSQTQAATPDRASHHSHARHNQEPEKEQVTEQESSDAMSPSLPSPSLDRDRQSDSDSDISDTQVDQHTQRSTATSQESIHHESQVQPMEGHSPAS